MEPVETAAPAPPAKRKRIALLLMAAAALLLLLAFLVRGTWSTSEARNPASSAEGVVTQLFRTPDGRKQVRCARVVDRPAAELWRALTDYDRFPELFPTVLSATSAREPDGRFRVKMEVDTPLGKWPVDVRIRHQESPPYVADWDEPSGSITTNRGSWTLTPVASDKTLLVYALEVEFRQFPNVLVRNVFLSRQKGVVNALAAAVLKRK